MADKVVASIEVTRELVTHLRATEILNLAERTAKDMSLRFQVEDMNSAVVLIDTLVTKLTPIYDRIAGDIGTGQKVEVNIETLNAVECEAMKRELSKTISQLDKRISSEGK
jgi:hypothetical protein